VEIETETRIEAAKPEPQDKIVRMPHGLHCRLKAAASAEGRDLRGFLAEIVERELNRREVEVDSVREIRPRERQHKWG